MKKPIIGIAGSLRYSTEAEFIGAPYDSCNHLYSECVSAAGGIPIYLPVTTDPLIMEAQLAVIDGLLLPGGADVTPLLYHESPRPLQGSSNTLVDDFQLYLAKQTIDTNKPVLGICRGEQLLNIALGGTLHQDLTYATSSPFQHVQKSLLSNLSHAIELEHNSILYDLFGSTLNVNSCHHQCINKLGDDLKVTATSADGIIEGIESTTKSFVVGVQWHPEMLALEDKTMLQLFKRFVTECTLI